MRTLMSNICRLLPALRLYAQTFTGSRERGDAYVRMCLEMIIEEPDRIRSDEDIRLELYRLFHLVIGRIGAPDLSDEKIAVLPLPLPAYLEDSQYRIQEALLHLPPVSRECVLLSSLEGFNVDTVASIVGLSTAGVRQNLVQARCAMSQCVDQFEQQPYRRAAG
jgi:DNA-directed RNA polymerase specialized sigma24 family protein